MARVARVPVSLVNVRTRDGITLAGLMTEPRRRRGVALIWVHGLGSTFASGQALVAVLARRLGAAGIAYLKLDTRGHHVVARTGKRLAGAAFERFGESVRDVRAMIDLARHAGYRRVILAGHSTGANKVLHYMARARDRRVAGLILLGPVSDIAGEITRVGRRELSRRVAVAERIARRDPDALVPRAFGFWSARRYLSLYRPGAAEDVFQYYRAGRWPALRKIRVPLAVVIGERDEYLDRPAAALVEAFARHATAARSFTGVVIPGALHGFAGQEDPLARVLVRWLARPLAPPRGARRRAAGRPGASAGSREGRRPPRSRTRAPARSGRRAESPPRSRR
jgi:pimeloyl-ACP methyl ester carboxylesterase